MPLMNESNRLPFENDDFHVVYFFSSFMKKVMKEQSQRMRSDVAADNHMARESRGNQCRLF